MTQAFFTELRTPRLCLRRLQQADLPTLLAYRTDPAVAIYQAWEAVTAAALTAFIAEQQTITPGQPGPGFQFAIEEQVSATHIGDCYFKLLDDDSQQAEIGYSLARAAQGRGYASEALRAVLDFGFADCGLHRMIAITDCANHASITLLERLHFRREGHFRQSFRKEASWRDEYQYALLGSEWLGQATPD